MPNPTSGYVSFIGMSLIDPIATLVEKLIKLERKGPNEVQASVMENGYSVSIVVVTVVMIESIINRTMYVMGKFSRSALAFFDKNFAESNIYAELEEVFVLRDTLVHNHTWEAKVEWA